MLPILKRKGAISSFLDEDFFKPVFNTVFESNYRVDEDGNTVLEIEVPGFNKDSLKVEVSDGILTVNGETSTRKLYKKYNIGNVEEAKAKIKDGILNITLIELKNKATKIILE